MKTGKEIARASIKIVPSKRRGVSFNFYYLFNCYVSDLLCHLKIAIIVFKIKLKSKYNDRVST